VRVSSHSNKPLKYIEKFKIMKYRNFILSIMFWSVACISMAITLPNSSYQSSYISDEATSEGFTLSTGTMYKQVYLSADNSNWGTECIAISGGDPNTGDGRDVDDCKDCCEEKLWACTEGDCVEMNRVCKNTCDYGPSLPLGTPLLLLPFIAIYAVIRKRKENAEQA
jgi:hypothetical protein